MSESAYSDFARFLESKLGIVLGSTRQYLVRSRLSSVAINLQYSDFNLFLQDVIQEKSPEATKQCLELMTTNETFWFRDEYPYAVLLDVILPQLSSIKNSASPLRIWSSACASGQEPYSIAMTIAQFRQTNIGAFSQGIEIIATDFSDKMIELASLGVYDELALSRGLPDEYRQRYFLDYKDSEAQGKGVAQKQCLEIHPSLKKWVTFRQLNLLNDYSSLGKFDIIFCRNVLIYFDGKQKQSILTKLAACLAPKGTLILGAAESINGSVDIFEMTSTPQGLYYTKR